MYDAAFYNCVVGLRHNKSDAVERRDKLLALTDCDGNADLSPAAIEVRRQLAKQYLITGDIQNAEKFQREASAATAAKFGKRSQITEMCKVVLAGILILKKQLTEAEQIFKAMIPQSDVFDSLTLSPCDFADVCDQYAALLRASSRPEEAAAIEKKAMTIRMNPPQPNFGCGRLKLKRIK